MKVDLIASTIAHMSNMEHATDNVWDFPFMSEYDTASSSDGLAEFAGRACYQSWDRPRPETAENKDYLANVIDQGHESVLAHASATFYVTGVSRSLTHELIRHRWLAYSELSQRYVDMKDADFVIPPAITTYVERDELAYIWREAKESYETLVNLLEERGLTRKKAREAARAVLPGMTETKIVVSGNIRAWRDFLKQRLTKHADAEICEFAREVYNHLLRVAPNSLYGIEDFEENK